MVPSFLLDSFFIRTVVRPEALGAVDATVSVVFSIGGTANRVTTTVPDAVEVLGVLRPVAFPDTVSASPFLTTAVSMADSKELIPGTAAMEPVEI